jgi:hypothetical protein
VQPENAEGRLSTSSAATSAPRDELVAFSEAHSSLVGQLVWIGMRRCELPYRPSCARPRLERMDAQQENQLHAGQQPRVFGSSDPAPVSPSAASRSWSPLGYGAVVLVARPDRASSPNPVTATTVLLIAGFGALNALGLSVVGAYAWRAFENTKGRPLAIVQRRYTFGEDRSP